MKIFNLVSNIVIIVALVVMWIWNPKTNNNDGVGTSVNSSARLDVAYVNIDSVLMNYQLAIDLNEELMTQQEEARTNITAKGRKLESEMATFQHKVENNGFLNQQRAQSEQQRLIAEQKTLEELQQRLSNELSLKQQDVNEQVMTAITDFIAEYNKKAGYEMILTRTGGIGTLLYAKASYNVTEEVLVALNKQYKK